MPLPHSCSQHGHVPSEATGPGDGQSSCRVFCPGFVLSAFPPQFSKVVAPGVTRSFKQFCAHLRFILFQRSQLVTILCCQLPCASILHSQQLGSVALSTDSAPSLPSLCLDLLYASPGQVFAWRKQMQAKGATTQWTGMELVLLVPPKLLHCPGDGWEGMLLCRHWRWALRHRKLDCPSQADAESP